jgi:hypothetical protein
MEIIRYGVSRDDLHNLLRMIGVLQPQERVIAVSDADPLGEAGDLVIVTVSTAPAPRGNDRSGETDKELQQRRTELNVMREAASQELSRIQQELAGVNEELRRREISGDLGADGIPDVVAMNIRSQIRNILWGDPPNRDIES